MKANKPKAPKEKITFDNVNPDEFDKYFTTIRRGTYVSKGKLSEWVNYSKGLEKLIEDKDGNLTILSSKIYDMRKEKEAAAQNFKESQKEHNRCNELIVSLSEENKALKERNEAVEKMYRNADGRREELKTENNELSELLADSEHRNFLSDEVISNLQKSARKEYLWRVGYQIAAAFFALSACLLCLITR